VLAPEVCGVSDTSIELTETASGLERLFEMVIQRGEKMDGKLEEKILNDGKDPDLTVEGMMAKVHSVLHPVDKTIEYPGVGKSISYGTSISPQSSSTGVSAAEIENLTERVEKRGNQWCVVHCHGPEAGTVIKCFDSEAEAMAMHNAMQANAAEIVQRELKVTMENLPKTLIELCGLGDHYNAAALAVNKWKTEIDAKVTETLRMIDGETAKIQTLKESFPEARKMLALVETQQILYENAKDKLKGQFKGKQKSITQEDVAYHEDPMKTMRRTLDVRSKS
jgi:hypothetical protein